MAFNKYQYDKLRAKRHANKVKHKQEIYEIRHANDPERKKPAYGKLLVGFIFVDCLLIQFFIMMMIFITKDMSQISGLVGLIGTLFVQGISLISYNVKATRENTQNGIVYEMAMRDTQTSENQINDVDVSDEDAVG